MNKHDPILVVAVDPGKKCGIARYLGPPLDAFESQTVPSDEVVDEVLAYSEMSPYNTFVVCERYTIGGRTVKMSRQPTALEVIGELRGLCRRKGFPFHMQNVADAKKMGRPELLRKLGWWYAGDRDDDANMAASHALLALARHFPVMFERLVRPVQ